MENKVSETDIIERLTDFFGFDDYEDFAKRAERGQDLDLAKSVGYMVDGFVDNCGVSAGIRTVYYDAGWQLYDKFLETEHPLAKELEGTLFYDAMDRFSESYTDEFEEYDISILDIDRYLQLCRMEMASNGNVEQVDALCYGVWLVVADDFRLRPQS